MIILADKIYYISIPELQGTTNNHVPFAVIQEKSPTCEAPLHPQLIMGGGVVMKADKGEQILL